MRWAVCGWWREAGQWRAAGSPGPGAAPDREWTGGIEWAFCRGECLVPTWHQQQQQQVGTWKVSGRFP